MKNMIIIYLLVLGILIGGVIILGVQTLNIYSELNEKIIEPNSSTDSNCYNEKIVNIFLVDHNQHPHLNEDDAKTVNAFLIFYFIIGVLLSVGFVMAINNLYY